MAVAKTLAYCGTATITAVKGFIRLVPGANPKKAFYDCNLWIFVIS
jgi:hypothetical protein